MGTQVPTLSSFGSARSCRQVPTLETKEHSPLWMRAILPSSSSQFLMNPHPQGGQVGTQIRYHTQPELHNLAMVLRILIQSWKCQQQTFGQIDRYRSDHFISLITPWVSLQLIPGLRIRSIFGRIWQMKILLKTGSVSYLHCTRIHSNIYDFFHINHISSDIFMLIYFTWKTEKFA